MKLTKIKILRKKMEKVFRASPTQEKLLGPEEEFGPKTRADIFFFLEKNKKNCGIILH